MECAMAARRRGHNVTIFEKSDAIGGNFKSYATLDLANTADLLSVVRHYEVMAKKPISRSGATPRSIPS